MYSTLLLGIAFEIVIAASTPTPNWQPDYKTARALAAKDHRPLVVVVGSGQSGWNQLASEGKFQDAVDLNLRSKYVWVYLDTDSEKGKKLAGDFQIKGPGLIISCRGGEMQAYRRVGALEAKTLNQVLVKFVEADLTVRRTEYSNDPTAPTESVSYYTPASLNNCLT